MVDNSSLQWKPLVEMICKALVDKAAENGLKAAYSPDLKAERLFLKTKEAQKLFPVTGGKSDLDAIDIPQNREVLTIDSFTLLITTLSSAQGVEQFDLEYKRAVLWAAMIRSHLPTLFQDDLHLIFLTDQMSELESAFVLRCDSIEQDERFCRKLVFKPSDDNKTAMKDLIGRMFLARPWQDQTFSSQAELDAVAAFSKNIMHERIENKVISSWIRIAGQGDVGGRDLVELLLREFEGNK